LSRYQQGSQGNAMPQSNKRTGRRPSLSMPILRTSRAQHRAGNLTLGSLLAGLGERSFGWAIVVFSLITILPLPPGSSVITALPLLVTTLQMTLGFPHVRLPGPLARMQIDRQKLRRRLLGLRPVTRRLERRLRPRLEVLFARRQEPLLGLALFVIASRCFCRCRAADGFRRSRCSSWASGWSIATAWSRCSGLPSVPLRCC